MTLRTRLTLATTAVVVVLFGVSEWMNYEQTSLLLDEHERILVETTDHAVALARLQQTRDRMLLNVTASRVLHALITLIVAVAVLNYVWYRVIYRPIQRLLQHINLMGRGTWTTSIPIHRDDEIGELTAAFNQLGEKLATTVKQITTSSRLSALALLGHRLIRRIGLARNKVSGAAQVLEAAQRRRSPAPDSAVADLHAAAAQLEAIENQFHTDFDREVRDISSGVLPNGAGGSSGALPTESLPSSRIM